MDKPFLAEPFFDPGNEELRFLPEGPRVLQNPPQPGKHLLGWVAIQHAADATTGSLNVLDLQTKQNTRHDLPGRPGFFAETTSPGKVLVGLERRLVLYNLLSRQVDELGITVTDHPRVIINDGLAVPGGVYFGTKHLDFNQPVAALYFYDAAKNQLSEVQPGQTCSNGKIFRQEATGPVLYDIDTSPKQISRYRMDSLLPKVLEQQLVLPPDTLPTYPDGMRPSPDGGAVLAFFNPEATADGLAWHLDLSTGKVLHTWQIPGSPRVTCPEFVLLDGKVKLLFTTALEGMPKSTRAMAPGAGMMYIAETPFTKLPPAPPLVAI